MTLSIKQRAQVNAALCIIYDSGLDTKTVTTAAKAIISQGHPATFAYSSALTEFAATNPTLGATISKVTRLIQNSSTESVAQYDHALSHYINTGNDKAMQALAPMIAKDSVALAIRHGEMTEADVANGGFTAALGAEPTVAMTQAFAGTAPAPALTDATPEDWASQISPVAGSGITSPNAQAAKARWGYTGFTPVASPFNGLTSAATREAARSAAAGEGRGFIPAPPVAGT